MITSAFIIVIGACCYAILLRMIVSDDMVYQSKQDQCNVHHNIIMICI